MQVVIDTPEEEIRSNIRHNNLRDYKYVIPNNNVKRGTVNAPGYPDGRRLMIFTNNNVTYFGGLTIEIDNKENYVNDFAIALNPQDCKIEGFNINLSYDIVTVETGGNI